MTKKVEKSNTPLQPSLDIADVRYQLAIAALSKIAEPIIHLKIEAALEGNQIDGIRANQLANNAQWLRRIAKSALGEIYNCT